ncbi:MAG: alpha/beta hydrolase [Chitinophagaceae bacterium]
MKVYFVSGLAADSRVFKNIQLPAYCEPIFLEWITPLKKESLKAYALRLAEPIDRTAPFAIIGLSMGGMITTEIARQYKPAFTILISSVPASADLPFYFKAAGKLRLHKMVPVSLVKSAAKFKRVFTTETAEDKAILRNIIQDSDSKFIYWAMDAILKWQGETLSTPYIHIHGTQDEILPLRYTKPTHVISKGGHLMVMNRAGEVNTILKEVLQDC